MIPKRTSSPKMGIREDPRYRSASYMQHVRGYECALSGQGDHICRGRIEAHHVRLGTDGAASTKPSDFWCIPVCAFGHSVIHSGGEHTAQTKYGLDFKAIAKVIWWRSPHKVKYERD